MVIVVDEAIFAPLELDFFVFDAVLGANETEVATQWRFAAQIETEPGIVNDSLVVTHNLIADGATFDGEATDCAPVRRGDFAS